MNTWEKNNLAARTCTSTAREDSHRKGKGSQKDNLEVGQKQRQNKQKDVDPHVLHQKKAEDASETFSFYDWAINDVVHLKLFSTLTLW